MAIFSNKTKVSKIPELFERALSLTASYSPPQYLQGHRSIHVCTHSSVVLHAELKALQSLDLR